MNLFIIERKTIEWYMFQTSTSDIRVNWEVFNDVEQVAETRHTSAIRSYHLGIGI